MDHSRETSLQALGDGPVPYGLNKLNDLNGSNPLKGSNRKEWLKMSPGGKARPARHAVTTNLRGDMLFRVEIIAVL